MKNKNKYIKLASKLNRLTKEEKLEWEKSIAPFALREGVNTVWIDFYKTCYADTFLGVGEGRFEAYSEYHDTTYWDEKVVWALLDDDGVLKYELPIVEGLWNLLETIRYLAADVDNTIDHLINAPDVDEDED